MKLTAEELDGEHGQWHFAIFGESEDKSGTEPIIAIVVARPKNSKLVQLRQMAVEPSAQGKGVGKKLLQDCESNLIDRGFTEFQLDARASVVPFYEKQGYTPVGDPFEKIKIEHQKMMKTAT